jgi:beta-glucosidase
MSNIRFPADFLWGAATSAYQIEGAVREDGRGETIWDRFCATPGKIFEGHTGEVACDHYHRFREDVALMRELGLRSYRFSVAWARIFPAGGGRLNPAGLDFYQRLIDELVAGGITPLLTLYHWDLPQALQDRGGWEARDTAGYFADYAAALFHHLGDRVRLWITHNEPCVAAYIGYGTGEHAPGIRSQAKAVQAAHHILLSHALAVKAYREQGGAGGRIGISLDLHPALAASDHPEDRKAAALYDAQQNRWFLDPVFHGRYPQDLLEILQHRNEAPPHPEEDLKILAACPVDFLGVNYYFRQLVRRPQRTGELYAPVRPDYPGARFTEMGWEEWPDGLYELLKRLDRDYGRPELYVTENGAACPDERMAEGRIDDQDRVRYLREHIAAAGKALSEGVRLRGYQVWSLLDNFEWAHGYSKRFGLVHVDRESLRRTPKQSALWYRRLIAEGGLLPV